MTTHHWGGTAAQGESQWPLLEQVEGTIFLCVTGMQQCHVLGFWCGNREQ